MLLVLRNHLLFSSVLSCPAALVSLSFLVVVSHDLNHGVLSILGRDVIAQAQSGTGKTATFSISILQKIDHTQALTQALVMAPTRELAQQV